MLLRPPGILGGTARAGADPGRHELRLAVTFALALVVAAAQPAVAAISTIVAERDGNTTDIRASAVLNSNVATAWRVLTDYNRYPEFIPDLPVSRVVGRRGATVTVEQSGDAALWLFKTPSMSPSRSTRFRRTVCHRALWRPACAHEQVAMR